MTFTDAIKNCRRCDRNVLSFFCCLAYHFDSARKGLVSRARKLWSLHGKNVSRIDRRSIESVSRGLDHAIFLFTSRTLPPFKTSNWVGSRTPVYLSLCAKSNTFRYIKNIDSYLSVFTCSVCGRLLNDHANLIAHEKTCKFAFNTPLPKARFRTGRWANRKTVVDELKSVGVCIQDPSDFVCDTFSVMDSESLLVMNASHESEFARQTKCYTFTNRHKTFAVCVVDNVRHETKIFYAQSHDDTSHMKNLILHLLSLQRDNERLRKDKLEWYFRQLRLMIEDARDRPYWKKRIEKAMSRLEQHVKQFCVLSWGGSHYDYTTFQQSSFFPLLFELAGPLSCIKRGNKYLMLSAGPLKFLDFMLFQGHPMSLRSYLVSVFGNDAEFNKKEFPYRVLRDVDSIKEGLPAYEWFENDLCGSNQLHLEYEQFQSYLQDGLSEAEALKQMGLKDAPPTGEQRYASLVAEWQNEGFTTVGDILEAYIIADCKPLMHAISKVIEEFKTEQINAFDFVSISSISLSMAHTYIARHSQHHVMLFDGEFREKIQSSLLGGPSFVLSSRYAVADESRIRPHDYDDPKVVKSIQGFDCVGLYSYCMKLPLAVGTYALRQPGDGYVPHLMGSTRSHDAILWLEWHSFRSDQFIEHVGNVGERRLRMRRDGKIVRVDGFCEKTRTVYEYMACQTTHGLCPSCRDHKEDYVWFATGESGQQLWEKTRQRFHDIVDSGFKLITGWSCDWYRSRESDEIAQHVIRHCTVGPVVSPNPCTENDLLEGIENDTMWGFVECDLVVPMEDRDRFRDLPVIFKKELIGREQLVEPMLSYCKEHDKLPQPTLQLVAGYHAERAFMFTSYLRWLLEHGVKVYNITSFYQFHCAPILAGYVEEMKNRRTEADLAGNSVQVSLCKTRVNGVYGASITNPKNHKRTTFTQGRDNLTRHLFDPFLVNIEELTKDLYEVTTRPRTLEYKTPATIGHIILQNAKFYLLSFIYDFLHKFLDRSTFEFMFCDTDSAYFQLSASTIRECVKPDMLKEFDKFIYDYLVDCSTLQRRKETRREPGRWCLETEGKVCIALSSKCHFISKEKGRNTGIKVCSKGVSKRRNWNVLTREMYERALFDRSAPLTDTTNAGFLAKHTHMLTYLCKKNAISAYYAKRKVLDCWVHTEPYDWM